MTDSFLNILKWFRTLTERLFIWIVSRWDWQCICGGSSVLKSTRSSICLHPKSRDTGQMKVMRTALPNTAQKTAECSRQTTCRKTEYIAGKKKKAFDPTAHLGPVQKLPRNPLERLLLTFGCSFLWIFLKTTEVYCCFRSKRILKPGCRVSICLQERAWIVWVAYVVYSLGYWESVGQSLAAGLIFMVYLCTYRSPFWLHSISEGILMSELWFSPFK